MELFNTQEDSKNCIKRSYFGPITVGCVTYLQFFGRTMGLWTDKLSNPLPPASSVMSVSLSWLWGASRFKSNQSESILIQDSQNTRKLLEPDP